MYYVEDVYTLTLVNGADDCIEKVEGAEEVKYKRGEIVTVTATLKDEEPYYYTFTGWSDGTSIVESNLTTYTFEMPAKDLTLTASATRESRDQLTITFVAEEGTISESERYVYEGREIGTLPTVTVDGITYGGLWYADETHENSVNSTYRPTESITLYIAIPEPITATGTWTRVSASGYSDQYDEDGKHGGTAYDGKYAKFTYEFVPSDGDVQSNYGLLIVKVRMRKCTNYIERK